MPYRDARMQVAHEDARSVGDLFRELSHGVQKLIKSELALAKIEMKESVLEAKRGMILLAIAVVPAVVGLVALAIGLTWLIATALPLWAAGFLVALASFGGAGALALTARRHLTRVEAPDRTMEQLEETKKWLSHPLSS